MRRLAVLTVSLVILVTGCAGRPPLPAVSPEAVGLSWRECPTTGLELEQVAACFGPSPLGQSEAGRAATGTRTGRDLHLTIGSDVYEVRAIPIGVVPMLPDAYVLSRNARPLRLLLGYFETNDPNLSLRAVAGKAAWEFADGRQATVIYDGQDLRRTYGVEAVYRPSEIAGKLICIGRRAGKYLVIYDGQKVGPEFDRIMMANCCEAMLYSPRGGEGRYRVWGERGGQLYAVEIAAAQEDEVAIYLPAHEIKPADMAGVDLQTLALEPEPFIGPADILAYNRATHEMTLAPAAAARLGQLRIPVWGIPFVVCVGRQPIYYGAFWTPLSSQSYDGVIIQLLDSLRGDTVRIDLGYPGSRAFRGSDPRADPRILQALERAEKLK